MIRRYLWIREEEGKKQWLSITGQWLASEKFAVCDYSMLLEGCFGRMVPYPTREFDEYRTSHEGFSIWQHRIVDNIKDGFRWGINPTIGITNNAVIFEMYYLDMEQARILFDLCEENAFSFIIKKAENNRLSLIIIDEKQEG